MITPPKTGRSRSGSASEKSFTLCVGDALRRGVMMYDTIFIVRDWNISILACFSGEPIHRVFYYLSSVTKTIINEKIFFQHS
jgi:hypothetical protein